MATNIAKNFMGLVLLVAWNGRRRTSHGARVRPRYTLIGRPRWTCLFALRHGLIFALDRPALAFDAVLAGPSKLLLVLRYRWHREKVTATAAVKVVKALMFHSLAWTTMMEVNNDPGRPFPVVGLASAPPYRCHSVRLGFECRQAR